MLLRVTGLSRDGHSQGEQEETLDRCPNAAQLARPVCLRSHTDDLRPYLLVSEFGAGTGAVVRLPPWAIYLVADALPRFSSRISKEMPAAEVELEEQPAQIEPEV